jgi:hypothetical protein
MKMTMSRSTMTPGYWSMSDWGVAVVTRAAEARVVIVEYQR